MRNDRTSPNTASVFVVVVVVVDVVIVFVVGISLAEQLDFSHNHKSQKIRFDDILSSCFGPGLMLFKIYVFCFFYDVNKTSIQSNQWGIKNREREREKKLDANRQTDKVHL